MAIFQAKNVRSVTVSAPAMAGQVFTQIVSYAITSAYTVGDIIELTALPPNCRVVGLSLASENIAAVATLDVGYISGVYGDKLSVRTCGNELLAAAAKNVTAAPTVKALFGYGKAALARGLGVKLSANEAAGTGVIYLKVDYTAG